MFTSSKEKWEQRVEVDSTEIKKIAEELDVSIFFVEICFQRGLTSVKEIQEFISIDETWFHDPFSMYEMDKATDRIIEAIQKEEQITIYGDYDADGITSTALLLEVLDSIGANVNFYLPNRFDEGYGPNIQAFETIINDGTSLIITVDNGISGHKPLEYAQKRKVDVIVTDHHQIPEVLPPAYAIIHPDHPQGNYPFKELAGVGVALKVASALTDELPTESLELAAIGTIADLVPLKGENRAIVYYGMKIIENTVRIGLLSLFNEIEIDPSDVDEEIIGFQISPRLNAIGRLGDASPGVELLSTYDTEKADKLSQHINKQNEQRKEIVRKTTLEIFEKIEDVDDNQEVIILADENWHQGILGIVASRVVEKTGKPTILFTIDSETKIAKGSGRSIESINLYEAIAETSSLLESFGGHEMAAGVTIHEDDLDEFKRKISLYIKENKIETPIKYIDAVSQVEDITVESISELNQLRPFGSENTKPLIACQNVSVQQNRAIGADKSHLKMTVKQDEEILDIISFQNGSLNDLLFEHQTVSILGYIEINEWNGFTKPQMQMTDIKFLNPLLIDQRVSTLSKNHFSYKDKCYVFFNKNIYEKYKEYIPNTSESTLLSTEDRIKEFESNKELIIVECPKTISDFEKIISKQIMNPIRCYFYKENHLFLSGLPNRADFVQVFKYISKYKNINLQKYGHILVQDLKIESMKLLLIIQVFLEAKFVTIEDGLLNIVNNPNKVKLEDTNVFKNAQLEFEAEKLFIYSSFNEIIKKIK